MKLSNRESNVYNYVINLNNTYFKRVKLYHDGMVADKPCGSISLIANQLRGNCLLAIEKLDQLLPYVSSDARREVFKRLKSDLESDFMDCLDALPDYDEDELMDSMDVVENIFSRFDDSLNEVDKAEEVLSEYVYHEILHFAQEESHMVTETVDEILAFIREKASHVSRKEWREIRYEIFNLI